MFLNVSICQQFLGLPARCHCSGAPFLGTDKSDNPGKSPPFLSVPFVCYPAAVRLPLVTVSGRAAALFVVLERCNAESVFFLVSIRDPQRLPFSFRSGTLRTLVIVSERSHTTVNLFTLVLVFSQLQQLRCVLIASPKVPRKAPLLCLFMRVTVFTNCNVVK